MVREDCSLPQFGEVFVVGDAACAFGATGAALPTVSAVAVQMGGHVGRTIVEEVADPRPNPRRPFSYTDDGCAVALGRGRAVAQRKGRLRRGRLAFWRWVLQLSAVMPFPDRRRKLLGWAWSYLRYRRGARVITGPRSVLTDSFEGREPVYALSAPSAEVERPASLRAAQ